MTTRDWRGIAILPLLILCFGFVGGGMPLAAAVAGMAVGACLVGGR